MEILKTVKVTVCFKLKIVVILKDLIIFININISDKYSFIFVYFRDFEKYNFFILF